MSVRRILHGAVLATLLTGLIVSVAMPATAQTTEPSMTVELQTDGSARVSVVYTFDLTTENDTDAFEELRNDSAERTQFRESFRQRMAGVANSSENVTGREMAITNSSIDLQTDNQTGVVELGVDWTGFAAIEDGTLVVTEPFASDFTTDRTLTLVVPDGYEVDSTTPTPDSQNATAVSYGSGQDLDGFELRAATTTGAMTTTGDGTATTAADATAGATTTPADTTAGSGAGFGVVAALLALALAAFATRRHR